MALLCVLHLLTLQHCWQIELIELSLDWLVKTLYAASPTKLLMRAYGHLAVIYNLENDDVNNWFLSLALWPCNVKFRVQANQMGYLANINMSLQMVPILYKTLPQYRLRVRLALRKPRHLFILFSVLRHTMTTCSHHPNLVILLVSQYHLYLPIQVNTDSQDIYHLPQYLRHRRLQEFYRLRALQPLFCLCQLQILLRSRLL